MNYYNPYFYSIPNAVSTPKTGLFSRLFGGTGVSLGRILNGAQKAMNFANQAIPLVKQVRPMIGNAKTMFKVMNEFKRAENPKVNNNIIDNTNTAAIEPTVINNNIETEVQDNYIIKNDNNGPTFFM